MIYTCLTFFRRRGCKSTRTRGFCPCPVSRTVLTLSARSYKSNVKPFTYTVIIIHHTVRNFKRRAILLTSNKMKTEKKHLQHVTKRTHEIQLGCQEHASYSSAADLLPLLYLSMYTFDALHGDIAFVSASRRRTAVITFQQMSFIAIATKVGHVNGPVPKKSES